MAMFTSRIVGVLTAFAVTLFLVATGAEAQQPAIKNAKNPAPVAKNNPPAPGKKGPVVLVAPNNKVVVVNQAAQPAAQDQGEKQNGQAGDQGEKQNGQAGD